MKLISMTDFVLEQNKEPYFYYDSLWNKVIAYANFLKQPLTLGMFVPCDSNGNVVKKPDLSDANGRQYDKNIDEDMAWAKYHTLIKQGKQKVIFKDFQYSNFCILGNDCAISIINDIFRIANTYEDRLPSQEIKVFTIENLIPYNLDLAISF